MWNLFPLTIVGIFRINMTFISSLQILISFLDCVILHEEKYLVSVRNKVSSFLFLSSNLQLYLKLPRYVCYLNIKKRS